MVLRIERDHNRFKEIIRGRIKQDLRKYITRGELVGRQGGKVISIPVPSIQPAPWASRGAPPPPSALLTTSFAAQRPPSDAPRTPPYVISPSA